MTMADSHPDRLASILDPSRLTEIHDLYFKWADTSGLTTGGSMLHFFSNDDIASQMYKLTFEAALKPLSTIPQPEIPSLLGSLPSPSSPKFPVLASGLHLLLDQAPRLTLQGVDKRWTAGFFQDLAIRFAQDLTNLPAEWNPQRIQRWVDLGYGYEAAWMRAFSLLTAYIHAEQLEAQLAGQKLVEVECRVGAEMRYGVGDPTRKLDEQDLKDTVLFSKMFGVVGEGAEKLSQAEAAWRFCRIVRAHEPIIKTFGRYPYRNGILGRGDALEEAEYLKETGYFGACDAETAEKIKDDVSAMKWTPLQGGQPGN